jgi:hypothetical protein
MAMRPTRTHTSAAAPVNGARAERAVIVARVADALDRGLVSPQELDRLLDRAASTQGRESRPTAAAVLSALGAVVVFGGLAIAYGTVFADLSHGLRLTTPFIFPLAALAAVAVLWRRNAALWLREGAGLVVYLALAGAFVTAGSEGGWTTGDHVSGWYVTVCALAGGAIAVALFAAIRSLRLLALGLGAAAGALGLGVAHVAGVSSAGTMAWVILGEAFTAAAAAVVLLPTSRAGARYASYWAMVGVWAASAVGASAAGPEQLSIWHAILIAAVVTALIVAAIAGFNGLIWLAAVAGLQWLQMIAVVVGSATNSALAVVLAGLGLLVLSVIVRRATERARPAG